MKKQKIRAIAICAIVLVLSNLLLIGGGIGIPGADSRDTER